MASNPSAPVTRPASVTPAGLSTLELPVQASVLLASDMHLGEHDTRTAQWFSDCLKAHHESFTHLILLGDLFEAWTGDDQNDVIASQFVQLLHGLSRQKSLYVMRGNRDFLLDQPIPGQSTQALFSQQTGVTMLADPCMLRLADQQWLLTHGDMLCPDDQAYQQFRRESRRPEWARSFLSQSPEARSALARKMREQSMRETANKTENLTDVNQASAQQCMETYGVTHLVHGHTHRPARHEWSLNGRRHHRNVLPDWDASRQTGGFMLLNKQGLRTLPPGAPLA